MKKIFLLVVLTAIAFTKPVFAQDTNNSYPLSALLPAYYDIKNAMVNADAPEAAIKASDFLNIINNIDTKSAAGPYLQAFISFKDKLAFDARHISESKDIAHQREHFASISLNFFKLVKSAKLTDHTVYYDYCPMQKSYWLSADAVIRNPYYGKQMPTCGKIAETLNK